MINTKPQALDELIEEYRNDFIEMRQISEVEYEPFLKDKPDEMFKFITKVYEAGGDQSRKEVLGDVEKKVIGKDELYTRIGFTLDDNQLLIDKASIEGKNQLRAEQRKLLKTLK